MRVMPRVTRSVEHVGRPAPFYLFADETKVKRLDHVPKKSPVFLVLAQSRCPLFRRFVLQLVEIVVTPLLFLCRWKMPVVFKELLEACSVDNHHSGDDDTFRLHLRERVQSAIFIALHI